MTGNIAWPLSTSPATRMHDAGVEPATNWCQPLDDQGDRFAAIKPQSLVAARLTADDIKLIQSLELTDSNATSRQAFRGLVQALPLVSSEDGTGLDWIEELFGFVPDYRHDFPDIEVNGAARVAEYYVSNDAAAPLLVLHLLMLRSGFYRQQIVKITDEEFVNDSVVDPDFELNMLIGDPAIAQNQTVNVNEHGDLLDARSALFGAHYVFENTDPKFHELADLLGCIDVLVRVAADAQPGLKAYISVYDAWAS